MLDLQPIKDRLAAATPGPWTASPNIQPRGVAAVAEVNTVLVLSSGPLYGSPMQDASLIAHAPTDLAALVAEVERLRAHVQLYRGMPDLQPIKARLKWGDTIDDVDAVKRSYQEDIQALVPEVERLRIAVDMYRRITGDNEAEIKRLRGAIEAHRTQCHKTYKVAQAWWDEELWAVLDA